MLWDSSETEIVCITKLKRIELHKQSYSHKIYIVYLSSQFHCYFAHKILLKRHWSSSRGNGESLCLSAVSLCLQLRKELAKSRQVWERNCGWWPYEDRVLHCCGHFAWNWQHMVCRRIVLTMNCVWGAMNGRTTVSMNIFSVTCYIDLQYNYIILQLMCFSPKKSC